MRLNFCAFPVIVCLNTVSELFRIRTIYFDIQVSESSGAAVSLVLLPEGIGRRLLLVISPPATKNPYLKYFVNGYYGRGCTNVKISFHSLVTLLGTSTEKTQLDTW